MTLMGARHLTGLRAVNWRKHILRWGAPALMLTLLLLVEGSALAHGVGEDDKKFIEGSAGINIIPYMYLGAKHMVTGYDHLLFLVGVIFFLYRLKDVAAVRQPVHDRPQR